MGHKSNTLATGFLPVGLNMLQIGINVIFWDFHISILFKPKGVLHLYFKITNTFLKNDICIL